MANLQPAYLIIGEDPYLVSTEVGKVLAEVSALSVDEFSAADEPSAIIESLRTPSMLGERRIVVLRDAGDLVADSQRALIGYLEDPDESATLLLVSGKPLSKVAAAVKKVGRVVEVTRGKRNDVLAWVREEAKKRGLKLAGDGANVLVETLGEERMGLANGIEELRLAHGAARVGAEEIRRQFTSRADAKVFGFVDAVAGRETGSALEMLSRLTRQGESIQSLFWMLAKHFKMLLIAAEHSSVTLARELGIQDWRAEKLMRQVRGYSRDELVRAYEAFAQADHKMKKSEEPEGLTLERMVAQITAGDANTGRSPVRKR